MDNEPKILIVDDDPSAIQVLRNAIQGMGRISFATGGRDALNFLVDHPVDVVLLDANMPDMDGFETCRHLREDYPDSRILFVTASSSFDSEVHALELGAHDFIAKPINAPVVRARVGLHLKLKALQDKERQDAERQLRDSEKRFRSLFENLPLAYQALDRQGIWLDVNPAMAKLLGFERAEDMLGRCFCDYWEESPAGRGNQHHREVFEHRHFIEGEFTLVRLDGKPITVRITGRPQTDSEGRFERTHCVLVDVSERRALEREIMQANADLEQRVDERTAQLKAAVVARGQFLASMSHEIRTPMNAVLGIAQLLEDEPLSDEVRDMVQRIRWAGRSLLSIINDILDFSKIEAGQLHIDPHPFSLSELLSHIDHLIGSTARAKGLKVSIDDQSGVIGYLQGDALRLEQILTNLVGNAVKFTDRGGVEIHVSRIPDSLADIRLRFEVRDCGIGMTAEQVGQLFQAYRQAEGNIARRFGGTGLGLAICKQLVELMGGTIGVESTFGVGSTFWFELAFSPCEGEQPVASDKPAQPSHPLEGLHMLVADDTQLNRFILEKALGKRGAQVTHASDGLEAVECLRTNASDYDAVLMDVQMPGMDGLEATRLIRTELGLTNLPIIALSGGVMPEEKQAAIDAGMNEFMNKPVELDKLINMITLHCGKP